MKLVGSREQAVADYLLDASGTITTGGAAQLLLPQHMSRSSFMFVNNSASIMYVDFGAARATCALSTTTVSSTFTITNAGFGYTKPPVVRFMGGGAPQGVSVSAGPGTGGVSTMVGANTGFIGSAIPFPNWPSPPHPAQAHATLSSGAVNAIVLDDPGAAYIYAPYMLLFNNGLDPVGCAVPSATAGAGGFAVVANGGSLTFNGTVCPTDQCSVFCATTSAGFTLKYTT